MSEFEIPFAHTNVDGETVVVQPWDGIRGPEYRCPECSEVIVWRRAGREGSDPFGKTVREPHFAHRGDTVPGGTCGGGAGESHQHRAACMLIAQAVRAWMDGSAHAPTFIYRCQRGHMTEFLVPGAEEVTVDCRVPGAGIGGLEPDVCVRHGGLYGAIEVLHAHAVGESKVAAYAALDWWVEVPAREALSGGSTWRVTRASWAPPCQECERASATSRKSAVDAHERSRDLDYADGGLAPEIVQDIRPTTIGTLSATTLAAANGRARKVFTQHGGAVVREPSDNVIGRFKILRRTDGLFVVHDPEAWPPNGPVFDEENKARRWASSLADVTYIPAQERERRR